MQPITKRILEDIATSLSGSFTPEGGELWDILTALRGPDNHDVLLKEATTAVIRWKLGLPANSKGNNVGGATVNEDNSGFAELRRGIVAGIYSPDKPLQFHFIHHARAAFQALGMSWDRVNTRDET